MHELQVSALDLDAWASTLGARGELPRLIRRLIIATGKPLRVDFPGGELIGSPGWDGKLLVAPGAGTQYLPEGPSCWELTTEKGPTAKATKDYKKRTKGTDAPTRAQTTFVAVSLHNWAGKRAWEERRRKKTEWKDVRAFDAGDLEAWIDTAPVEALRIGLLLNKSVAGIQTLDEWWKGWCHETSPALSGDVVLAGRDEEAGAVGEWLANDGNRPTTAIWADTEDEAIAAFAGAIERLAPPLRDAWSTRAIVVKNPYVWQQLMSRTGPLLLLPLFREDTAVGTALQRGHRVMTPNGNATPRLGNDGIQLARLDRKALRMALGRLGIPEDKIDELARTGRGNLQALRRALGHRPEQHAPAWVGTEIGRRLTPSLLLGHWDESNDVDRDVAARLADIPYSTLESVLTEAAHQNDPPLRRAGTFWYFAARRDTWRLLASRITGSELHRFGDLVIKHLPDPEPRWDLPADQRWKASLAAPKTQLSVQARQGLIEGLVFLTLEEGSKEQRDTALGIVHGLLQACRTSWKVWATLGSGVADLAELAPEAFLATVEESLNETVPEILKLFGSDRGDSDPFPNPVLHTQLLWSLERLAWSPRYFARVAKVLGTLARHDPGGRYLNRPAASLYSIFCPWLPQTSAGLPERTQALSALQAAEPESAFHLLLALLPSRAGNEMLMPTGNPRWHNWKPAERRVTRAEYDDAVSDAARRLVELAAAKPSRWENIAKRLDSIPRRDREEVVAGLRGDAPRLASDVRTRVWNALRELVNSHREFTKAQWALPPQEVTALENLLPVVEPDDFVTRNVWLFGQHPRLGEERVWEAEQAEVERRRRDAVRSILDTQGVDGVRALASAAEVPGFVGRTLGQLALTTDVEDTVLREHDGVAWDAAEMFVRGFIGGALESGGAAWRKTTLNRFRKTWTPDRIALVYLMDTPGIETWDRIEQEAPEVQRAYWSRFWPLGLGHKVAVARPAEALLRHDQPLRAVALLGLYANEISDDDIPLAVTALGRAIKEDPTALLSIRHDILHLLARFARSETIRDRLVAFEWALLPLVLEAHEHPLVLYERLATDPLFFVELCTLAFRAEDEPSPSLSEDEKNRAMSAYRLLKSWHGPPGTTNLKDLDYETLRVWVDAVRAALQRNGRGVIGDLCIGEALGLPSSPQGEWPHPAVSRLLEELASIDIERGMELCVINSRGVYSPSAGHAEREKAREYRRQSDRIRTTWPRMAALVDRLADSYDRWAKREETEHAHSEDT